MDVDQNSGKTDAQGKGQSTMMPQTDQRGKERPPALDRSSAVKDVHCHWSYLCVSDPASLHRRRCCSSSEGPGLQRWSEELFETHSEASALLHCKATAYLLIQPLVAPTTRKTCLSLGCLRKKHQAPNASHQAKRASAHFDAIDPGSHLKKKNAEVTIIYRRKRSAERSSQAPRKRFMSLTCISLAPTMGLTVREVQLRIEFK